MQGRDSENVWSRFVFELVIWHKEVTLVGRTQPSGPLCLWQCFDFNSLVRQSYMRHIDVSLLPLFYCIWISFSLFIRVFVLSHFCLTGSQGIRWSWSWRESRRPQSLCPASLCRRTSTWDRTFLEEKKILPNVNSLQNKNIHLGIPRSLNYYIALAPTCWIHLLDENGEVEPALSCLKIKQA